MEQIYKPSTNQVVSIGAASAATSNAVGAQTRAIRLYATSDCHIAISKAPTATTSDMFFAACRPENFRIHPGEKVACIIAGGTLQQVQGGSLYVTELTQ